MCSSQKNLYYADTNAETVEMIHIFSIIEKASHASLQNFLYISMLIFIAKYFLNTSM